MVCGNIFKALSSPTRRARELKFGEDVHPHYVSCVTNQKKSIKKSIKKKPSEKIGQSGGASRWRVCYQRGLPRLV